MKKSAQKNHVRNKSANENVSFEIEQTNNTYRMFAMITAEPIQPVNKQLSILVPFVLLSLLQHPRINIIAIFFLRQLLFFHYIIYCQFYLLEDETSSIPTTGLSLLFGRVLSMLAQSLDGSALDLEPYNRSSKMLRQMYKNWM